MGNKIKKIKSINRLANEGIRQKVKQAREDKRHIELIIVELFLISMLVLSLLFLFDPNLSFPESNLDSVPWPLKMLIFLGGVAIAFKLYTYTKEFRFEKSK